MKIEKVISDHPYHPNHNLQLNYTENPFNCNGCKEAGIGFNYKCQQCHNFIFHKVCGKAIPQITHPFYNKCNFKLLYNPPGTASRYCDACRNDVVGFVYHCRSCGYDLHPCCANLPQVLGDGKHDLYLSRKLSDSCHHCGGRKGPGWSYRSQCKTYNLHLSCVKELLVENWEALYLKVDKNKVDEIQKRIPSLKGGRLQNNNNEKEKVKKGCQTVGNVVRCVVSAMLGDPTSIIAAVNIVGNLI